MEFTEVTKELFNAYKALEDSKTIKPCNKDYEINLTEDAVAAIDNIRNQLRVLWSARRVFKNTIAVISIDIEETGGITWDNDNLFVRHSHFLSDGRFTPEHYHGWFFQYDPNSDEISTRAERKEIRREIGERCRKYECIPIEMSEVYTLCACWKPFVETAYKIIKGEYDKHTTEEQERFAKAWNAYTAKVDNTIAQYV